MPTPISDALGWQVTQLRAELLGESSQWRIDAPPGSLRLAFVAPPAELRLTGDVAEGTAVIDELFLRDLAREIRDVGTPGVIAMIARPRGMGLRRDRRFAQALATLLGDGPTRLVDLLATDRDGGSSLMPRRTRSGSG